MDGVTKCVLFVALCLAVAECAFLGRLKREFLQKRSEDFEYYEQSCSRSTRVCEEGLEYYEDRIQGVQDAQDFFSSGAELQQLCLDLQNYTSCVDEVVANSNCRANDDYDVNRLFAKLTVKYICDEHSQELLMAASQSSCLNSEIELLQAVASFSECESILVNAIMSPNAGENICQAFLDLGQCFVNNANQQCGADAGNLVADIASYIIESGVPQQVWSIHETGPADFSCFEGGFDISPEIVPEFPELLEEMPSQPARRSMGLINLLQSGGKRK